MNVKTFEFVRLKQQHRVLKRQLTASIQRRDRAIGERAVLQYRRGLMLDVLERTPALGWGRVTPADSSQPFLQRQLKLIDQELTRVDQAIRLERLQIQKILRLLLQLSLQVRLKHRQARSPKPAASPRPQPSLWQVAPTYKQPNPLKDLRQQPQNRLSTVWLPWASVGLVGEMAIAFLFGLSQLAAISLVTLVGLWLLVAIVEALRAK